MAGLANFAKDRLGLSVRLGGEYALDGVSQSVRDPAYAVAVGLVLWGFERVQGTVTSSRFSNSFSPDIFRRGLKWLKNFLP